MARHNTATLEGALLDFAVARAEQHLTQWRDDESVIGRRVARNDLCGTFLGVIGPGDESAWSPSTDWAHGGPIIQRERISVFPRLSNLFEPLDWAAVKHVYPASGEEFLPDGKRFRYIEQHGETPLIAGMRAYVSSRFGEFVELP